MLLTSGKVNGGGGGRFNDKLTTTVAPPPSLPRKNPGGPQAQAPEDKIIVHMVLTPRKIHGTLLLDAKKIYSVSARGKIIDRMLMTFWKVNSGDGRTLP